jgi:Zn-dependent protease
VIIDFILKASLYVVPLLLAVIAHEVAHGWAAEKCGDPTARIMGRITLNPFAHVDLMGTVLLPLFLILVRAPFLFGWAKPVPVNFANLRKRSDMAVVAAAGPLTNFILAALSAALYHFILSLIQGGYIRGNSGAIWIIEPLLLMARISITLNLVLMIINLLPIPPLDGGRILVGLLPYPLAVGLGKIEKYGMLVLLILIATGMWEHLVHPLLGVFLRLFLGR